MKMLNKKILLELIEDENVTPSGIILTKPTEKRFCEFRVKEIDATISNIHVGDIVIADKMKSQKINDDYICHYDDVLAICEV